MTYERQFFQYLENLKRRIYAQPLNLGGVSSSGGGVGGPPGGFLGYLPQSRVTYDKLEAATMTIPLSGASLLDNLNHIRKRLNNVEASGIGFTGMTIEEDDIVVASGISIINFEGSASVTDNGTGKVTVVVSGSGGGAGTDADAIHDNVAAEISNVTLKGSPVSADELLIEDSANSYNKKSITIGTIPVTEGQISDLNHTDSNAIHDNVNGEINAITGKTTPVDGDLLLIEDSEASNAKKKVTVANLLATVSGSGASNFLGLSDTPSSYSGQAGKSAVVNGTEDALEFVTVSGSGGGGTPDWYKYDGMGDPTSGNAKDDEFDDESGAGTPSGWTEFDNSSLLTVSEDEKGLKLTPTGTTNIAGVYKAVPSNDNFSIETRVSLTINMAQTTFDQRIGLMLMEGAGATDNLYLWGLLYDGSGMGIECGPWDDYANEAGAGPDETLQLGVFSNTLYLRMRKYFDGFLFHYVACDYSFDGKTWVQVTGGTGWDNLSFTPAQFGIFIQSTTGYYGYSEFFRVKDAAASTDFQYVYTTPPLGGQKVGMFNDD